MPSLPWPDLDPGPHVCARCQPPVPATIFWESKRDPSVGLAFCEWCARFVGPLPGFTRLRK